MGVKLQRPKNRRHTLAATSIVALVALASEAQAISLEDAVATALKTNPSIGQAVESRRATEWELRQARGLYLPRVDVEASAGARDLDSPVRRSVGLAGRTLYPTEAGAVLTQPLINFATSSEVEYQASRVDGASLRVLERSENIALQIALAYHEILLKQIIVRASQDNITFHERLLADIRAGTAGGTLTIADQRQAEERLFAARAHLTETNEDLESARLRFQRLVGEPIGMPVPVRSLAPTLPANANLAVQTVAQRNPTIRLADADIDAAQALYRKARSDYVPTVNLEMRARTGHDVDGIQDRTNDYQALVVLRWPLFNGVRTANVQEQIRRVGEEWQKFYETQRQIEEELRNAYNRRTEQMNLLAFLDPQLQSNRDVVQAYRDQFTVGRRSLLDLLNAQNTLYNVQVLVETARSAISFAEYRIVAANGNLVATLGQTPPVESNAYARMNADVPAKPTYESLEPRLPPAPDAKTFFGKF
jgi:adhesin transport system outer membrane protein